MSTTYHDTGTAFRFQVTVDGYDVGTFTSCEGLSAEYSVMVYSEGGENGYEHRLPGAMKFSTIKLSRPIDDRSGASPATLKDPAAPAGAGLAGWFTRLAADRSRVRGTRTASITAVAPDGGTIAQWELLDAFPVKWTGPSFTADGTAIVKETLELAHHGFI